MERSRGLHVKQHIGTETAVEDIVSDFIARRGRLWRKPQVLPRRFNPLVSLCHANRPRTAYFVTKKQSGEKNEKVAILVSSVQRKG